MNSKNIELIKQALGAAEGSIKLAKQLLSEIESGKNSSVLKKPNGEDLPGIVGIFDGENMVTDSGETFPVPANYASKSLLVVGDTLKLVEEGKNKDKRFKQIEHVKRHKSTGVLTKKDGKWKVVTPEGSYKVLNAAVDHFGAEIGSEVTLHIPANNLTVAYGAIEAVLGKEKAEAAPATKPEETAVSQPEQVRAEEKVGKPAEVVEKVVVTEKKPEPKKEVAKPKPAPPKKIEPKKEAPKVTVVPKSPEPPRAIEQTPPTPAPEATPVPIATNTTSVAPAEDELI